jgi:hypothetical protein
LRLRELRKQAKEAGISDGQLEDAADANDPKAAVIALLVKNYMPSRAERADRLLELLPEPELPVAEVEATGSSSSTPGGLDALRQELQELKLVALQRRAVAEGCTDEQLESAFGSDDLKGALIALIESRASVAGAAGARAAVLRGELRGLKLMALQRRAAAEGCTDEQLESAFGSGDPKGALVELLVSAPPLVGLVPAAPEPATAPEPAAAKASSSVDKPHSGDGGSRPHFGASTEVVQDAPDTQLWRRSAKHVMLSYNWAHQTQVKRVFDRLTELGLKVWMDTQGGMSTDVYDSMAEGVSNACAVVAFMSQKYQESPNCMLEVSRGRWSHADAAWYVSLVILH